MDDAGPRDVLGYSTPRTLFDRPYRYRSWSQAIGGGVIVFVGCVLLGISQVVEIRGGTEGAAARAIFWSVGALLALALAVVCVQWLRDDVAAARITDEGIHVRRTLYPWGRIGSVYGSRMAGGIVVEFNVRRPSADSFEFITLPKRLMTTPPLSLEEFGALMDLLDAQVVPHHPHVKLDRAPRASD